MVSGGRTCRTCQARAAPAGDGAHPRRAAPRGSSSPDTQQPHRFQRQSTNVLPLPSHPVSIRTIGSFSLRAADVSCNPPRAKHSSPQEGRMAAPRTWGARASSGIDTSTVPGRYVPSFWNGPGKFPALIFRKIVSL